MLLLRRLADELDEHPDGVTLDLGETADALGVGLRGGRNSPFMRTLERVCRFGAARWEQADRLAVRRKLPPLTRGQVTRLSPTLQARHQHWIESHDRPDEVAQMRQRSRHLALSLLELGEDAEAAERQLHRWRFHPAVAHDAVRWALDRRAADVRAEARGGVPAVPGLSDLPGLSGLPTSPPLSGGPAA